MAIDIALGQASKERQVDIPKIIVNMRRQRMKMVQTVVREIVDHVGLLQREEPWGVLFLETTLSPCMCASIE